MSRPHSFASQRSLIFGFSAMLVLMVLLTFIGLSRMEITQQQLDKVVKDQMTRLSLGTAMRSYARERTLILHKLLYLEDVFERDENEINLTAYAGKFGLARIRLLSMPLSAQERDLLEQQRKLTAIAYPLQIKVLEMIRKRKITEAKILLLKSATPAQDKVLITLDKLYEVQYQGAQDASERADRAYAEARSWMLVLSLGLVALGITIAVMIVRRNIRTSREREAYLAIIEKKNSELEENTNELIIARDEAQQASTAKTQFLANMSHELRTPLNAIIGFTQIVQENEEEAGNHAAVSDLSKILKAANNLLSLIDQILELTSSEAGKLHVNAESFNLNELLNEVMETIYPLAEKNGNQVTTKFNGQLGYIYSDKRKIQQILANLLSNACKFTEQGEISLQVLLKTNGPNCSLEIIISDTGIGLREDQIAKLYAPFMQGDNSTTRQYGGTGVGLTLTKRYCEILGGELKVTSELGKGTVFTISIPIEYIA